MSSTEVFIRAGVPEDARAVAAIHVAAWQVAFADYFPAELLAPLSVAQRTAAWLDRLAIRQGPDYFILIAESIDNGTVAGFCSAGGTRDEDRKGDGEVYALYVHPDWWRRGVGGALLAEALHRFTEASYEAAALWTLERNVAARAFYEASGWRADGASRPFVYENYAQTEIRYRHPIGEGREAPARDH